MPPPGPSNKTDRISLRKSFGADEAGRFSVTKTKGRASFIQRSQPGGRRPSHRRPKTPAGGRSQNHFPRKWGSVSARSACSLSAFDERQTEFSSNRPTEKFRTSRGVPDRALRKATARYDLQSDRIGPHLVRRAPAFNRQ